MGAAMVLGLPAWGTAGPVPTITPTTRVVALGSTLTLTASEAVTWSVLPQGSTPVGSITAAGVYTPPTKLPPSGRVVVRAQSTATSNLADIPVAIRSTTADGSFSAVGTIGVTSAIAGDVTGDGITDILDLTGSPLLLKRGVGDGTFAAATTAIGAGSFFNAPELSLADMNADGLLDVIAMYTVTFATSSTPTVEVWTNNGDGTFTKARSIPHGNWLRSVLAADFNGDGYPDLVIAGDDATNTVGYIPSDGANAGTEIGLATGSTGATRLLAGDVNGDGRLDLVVQSWGAIPGQTGAPVVSVLLNNGTGFDAAVVSVSTGPDNFPGPSIGLGDFNRDGRADLVIGDSAMGHTEVRLGASDGTFGAPLVLPDSTPGTFSLSSPFAIGHFNNDNNLDLVVPTFANGAQVFLGNGSGNFAAPISVGGPAGDARIANVDGDDRYDLVVFRDSNANVFRGGPIAAPATKSIAITPAAAEANAGKTRTFAAQVSGTTDTALDWFVTDVPGGNASIGTIAGTGLNATYTAPDPTAGATTATIQARLHSDRTIQGTATVTLTNYHWSSSSSGLGQSVWVRSLAQSANGATLFAGTHDG